MGETMHERERVVYQKDVGSREKDGNQRLEFGFKWHLGAIGMS